MSNSNREDESKNTENQKPNETSYFFGPIAFWFLVACLLIAIWFKLLPLIVIASFLLILSIWIYVWKENSLKNLNVMLDLTKSRLFAGDEFTVLTKIQNNKWLPLIWLECEFPRHESVSWGKKQTKIYIIRFLWLLSYQQIEWKIQGQALKRGVYSLDEIILRSGDGFRFIEKERTYNVNQYVYIYPSLLPIRVPPFQPSLQWEVQGSRGGFVEDPLLISGIREYEPGDEWRRFNWHASARTGKMLTNIYEPIISKQAMIFVDVQGFVIDKNKYSDDEEKQRKYEKETEESFEHLLSIITSFVVKYIECDISVGYASNGKSYLNIPQSFVAPSLQMEAVLDQIAQITQRLIKSKESPLETMIQRVQRGTPIIVFCERVKKDDYILYERYQQTFDIKFYYMTSSKYSAKIQTAKQIHYLLEQTAVGES